MTDDEFFLLELAYKNQPEVNFALLNEVIERFGQSDRHKNTLDDLEDKKFLDHIRSLTYQITLRGKDIYFQSKKERKKIEKDRKMITGPQKYWWVIMILSLIGSPILVELIKVKWITPPIQSQPAIPTLADTSLNRKNDSLP